MPSAREARFDFRGGVNRGFSEEVRDTTEVWSSRNGANGPYGSIQKELGTLRTHDSALPGPVAGVHFWIGPNGPETVALADGDFWVQNASTGATFSSEGSLDTSERPSFTQHTEFGSSRLFIANGSGLYEWDGTDLTEISNSPETSVLPDQPRHLAVYKGRLYVSDGSKTLYWSAVAQPGEFRTEFDASQANAETYDETGITGLAVVGGSLLIFKRNSIARFTGVSQSDIRLDQQTEGISADVGAIASGSVVRMEEACFFVSDRGPYLASEAGVQPIGVKVEPEFKAVTLGDWDDAVAVHHRGRQEIRVYLPTGKVWVYSYRTSSWNGPSSYPFEVSDFAMLERPDGRESYLVAGTDGWVRQEAEDDDRRAHDMDPSGEGGQAIEFDLEIRDIMFGDPSVLKMAMGSQEMAVIAGEYAEVEIETSGDQCPTTSQVFSVPVDGPHQHRFRSAWRGRRLNLRIRERTDQPFRLNGLLLSARIGRQGV